MQLSILLVKKIASLLFITAIGFFAGKKKLIDSYGAEILSKLHAYIITPCMILSTFQVGRSTTVLQDFFVSLVLSFLIQFLFIGITMIIRKPLKLSVVEQGLIEYTNCGNLVVPIVIALFGEQMLIYSLGYICSNTILTWTHMYSMMQGRGEINLKKMLTNINLICILVSLLLFILGVEFPPLILDPINDIGGMLGTIAMLNTGIIMGCRNIGKVFKNWRTYFISIMRIIIYPLISIAFYKLLRLDNITENWDTILIISFLGAISCSGSNVVQLSKLFGHDSEYASGVQTVTLIGCIVTMPLLLLLFQSI